MLDFGARYASHVPHVPRSLMVQDGPLLRTAIPQLRPRPRRFPHGENR